MVKSDNYQDGSNQREDSRSSNRNSNSRNGNSRNRDTSKSESSRGSSSSNLDYNQGYQNSNQGYQDYSNSQNVDQNGSPSQVIGTESAYTQQQPSVGDGKVESIGAGSGKGSNFLEQNIEDKGSLLLIIFLGAIGLYIVISGIIYFSSYIIKSKNDDLEEEFYKEFSKEKKEGNQFFMDPAIHKSPAIKSAEAEEGKNYKKLDNRDDYDQIWESFIVTGKSDDIEVNANKTRHSYPSPITTPVSPVTPIIPSPLQRSFTSDGFNSPKGDFEVSSTVNAKKSDPKRERSESSQRSYGHRESNSTSSSTASISNLIPKHQQKSNEIYNKEDIRSRNHSENKNIQRPPRQFASGRPSSPQVKFSLDYNSKSSNKSLSVHYDRNQLSPQSKSPQGKDSPALKSPRMQYTERQGSQGMQHSPSPSRSTNYERQGSHGMQQSLAPPRSANVERQGSQGMKQPPAPLRTTNVERQGSQGIYTPPAPQRAAVVERQGSQGIRPRNPNTELQGSQNVYSRPINTSQYSHGNQRG